MPLIKVGDFANLFDNDALHVLIANYRERQWQRSTEGKQYTAMANFQSQVTNYMYDSGMMDEPFHTTLSWDSGLSIKTIDPNTNRSVEISVSPDEKNRNSFNVHAIVYKDTQMRTMQNKIDEWEGSFIGGDSHVAARQSMLILSWIEKDLAKKVNIQGKGEWIPAPSLATDEL